MKRTFTVAAALFLTIGLTSVAAMASASGSIGCGGGNGASAPCNGQGLGTVTQSGMTVSGGVDVNLTGVSGLPSAVAGLQAFTPNTDQFAFSFSNVGAGSGGTFTFTDLTEPGVLAVGGTATLNGPIPSGLVGPLDLNLDATSYMFSFGTFSAGGTINVLGSAALTLDPGNVTSMTGSVGLPSLGATPEPGTLLLLGSGLLGFVPLIRRLL